MTQGDRASLRVADADRENTANVLRNALGAGRISVDELDSRLASVYSATTFGELESVTADLPAVDTVVADRDVPGSRSSVAVMSGRTRRDVWTLPDRHTSRAFWGGVRLDLRRAQFASRDSTISAVAVMGGIKILVPDDIHVEVDGTGWMGGFRAAGRSGPVARSAAAPTLRVTGFAFWGSVKVVRVPRDSSRRRGRRGFRIR